MSGTMKQAPDAEDEFRDASSHVDPNHNRLTPLIQLPPEAALAVVSTLARLVQMAHHNERTDPTPPGEFKRAQEFEEGEVYMAEPPFDGFFADRYIMDFYDVEKRDICSRMHLHTGLRFVRMMTGPDTSIRVSSLMPISIHPSAMWTWPLPDTFTDELPSTADTESRQRFNVIVPPNSWVDMQVPRGVSHQFNAVGPNAVIDSVHPEESIEVLREQMSGYVMMAQTIFLAKEKSPAATCLSVSSAAELTTVPGQR